MKPFTCVYSARRQTVIKDFLSRQTVRERKIDVVADTCGRGRKNPPEQAFFFASEVGITPRCFTSSPGYFYARTKTPPSLSDSTSCSHDPRGTHNRAAKKPPTNPGPKSFPPTQGTIALSLLLGYSSFVAYSQPLTKL